MFSIFNGKKNNVRGLALGGGGAKGSVHLGVLRAFEEEGIKFDVLSGASIGSVAGCLYAKGLSYKEIEAFVMASGIADVKNLVVARMGGDGIDAILQKALSFMDFSEMKKPFAAVAVDLESGEEKHFTDGNLIKGIAASCAIAPYFPPVEIDGRKYVDGAYRNIIPCDVVKSMGADFVVGVDLSNYRTSNEEGKRLLDSMYPECGVPISNPSEAGYEACDVMIAPDLTPYTATSFESIGEMFDLGYFAAKEKMNEIKEKAKQKKIDLTI